MMIGLGVSDLIPWDKGGRFGFVHLRAFCYNTCNRIRSKLVKGYGLCPHKNMGNDELIKQADVQRIATEGAKIYEGVKTQYDPKEKGKFLAIDIDTKQTYLAETSADAVAEARKNNPNKIFYVVKIGFDAAETMAQSFVSPTL